MLGLEQISGRSELTREVNIASYAQRLDAKLAVNGLSVLAYASRLAMLGEDVAAKVARQAARHGKDGKDRVAVAPELPELHNWLTQATTLRRYHELGHIAGPVASDRDIVAILAHYEPLYEEADKFYDD